MWRLTSHASLSDGIEEVFSSVGESVSLSCRNTSSLGEGGSVEWAVGGEGLSGGSSSLVIGKVSVLHAGEYQCSDSTDRRRVFNRIRLHTLEGERDKSGPIPERSPTPPLTPSPLTCVHTVTSESVGDHLALTCALTCARGCEGDSSVAWRVGGAGGWQNTSVSANGTLRNRLVLPGSLAPTDDLTCVVLSDGIVVASQKWHAINREYASKRRLQGQSRDGPELP